MLYAVSNGTIVLCTVNMDPIKGMYIVKNATFKNYPRDILLEKSLLWNNHEIQY